MSSWSVQKAAEAAKVSAQSAFHLHFTDCNCLQSEVRLAMQVWMESNIEIGVDVKI